MLCREDPRRQKRPGPAKGPLSVGTFQICKRQIQPGRIADNGAQTVVAIPHSAPRLSSNNVQTQKEDQPSLFHVIQSSHHIRIVSKRSLPVKCAVMCLVVAHAGSGEVRRQLRLRQDQTAGQNGRWHPAPVPCEPRSGRAHRPCGAARRTDRSTGRRRTGRARRARPGTPAVGPTVPNVRLL